MTLLIISPDYASHLLPLATLGTAWRGAGERVVVATGPATADIVRSFGFERVDLQLGRGSNPGVIRADQQPRGEDDALRGFFAATRRGMLETLLFQARARGNDLLWNPVAIADQVQQIVGRLRPDDVIVDHLAFSARLGLISGGIRHADVVLGHPSALSVGHEVYGYPTGWPPAFTPEPADLAALRRLCEEVRDDFTGQWNDALHQLDPEAVPSADTFAETGDVLLLNYPAALHDESRTRLLPPHAFLGSAVREEPVDDEVQTWLSADSRPVVYVSFGSFLSVRGDVLARVAAALRGLDVRAAIATGSTTSTRTRRAAQLLVGARLPAPGHPAPPRRARRLPRREQQRDGGDDRSRSASPAALLDRPVRGRGGRRSRRIRCRTRSEHRVGREAPHGRLRSPHLVGRSARPIGAAERFADGLPRTPAGVRGPASVARLRIGATAGRTSAAKRGLNCVHVLPHFGGAAMRMSPGRSSKPSQRLLS